MAITLRPNGYDVLYGDALPSVAVRDAMIAAGIEGNWEVEYFGDDGLIICWEVSVRAAFNLSEDVVRDSCVSLNEIVAYLAASTVARPWSDEEQDVQPERKP